MTYHDIELTEDELKSITRYTIFGQEWINRSIDFRKAVNFLDQVCDIERNSWNAGRCYNKGTIIYTRKDNEAIHVEDFEACQVVNHGQCNKYSIAEDGMSMAHYWECDSSD